MTDLIDHINTEIEGCIDNVETYGLCHLVEDTGGIYPATVAIEAERIAPNDQHDILIYHRLLNGSYAPREDLSFGKSITAQNAQRIRTVVFISLSLDQDKIDDIINALPDDFEVTGYQFANVSKTIDVIRDRAAIWNEEFGEAYRNKYQKRFQIHALEYSLEYIKCSVCETSP